MVSGLGGELDEVACLTNAINTMARVRQQTTPPWCPLPFLAMIIDIMIHYPYASWRAGEGSGSPNGLLMLCLLKMLLPDVFPRQLSPPFPSCIQPSIMLVIMSVQLAIGLGEMLGGWYEPLA